MFFIQQIASIKHLFIQTLSIPACLYSWPRGFAGALFGWDAEWGGGAPQTGCINHHRDTCRQTTITNNHTRFIGQFRVTSQSNMHAFGLWEKTLMSTRRTCKLHRERPLSEFEPGTFCEATVLFSITITFGVTGGLETIPAVISWEAKRTLENPERPQSGFERGILVRHHFTAIRHKYISKKLKWT